MKMREEPLPESPMTSMIDIIFQLMIFFLVTLSIMPAVKAAPQVEGIMDLPTPKKGNSEASVLVQFHKTPSGVLDFYVLQGNDNSAEFYKWLSETGRAVVNVAPAYPAFRNQALNRYQVVYDEMALKALLLEIRDSDPAVILRAPGDIPYGSVVAITGALNSAGITKIAWVKGTLSDLEVEIKKAAPRREATS